MEDNSEPGVKFVNIGFAAFVIKSKEPWFSANTFYSLSVPMVLDDREGENIQNNYRAYAFGKRHTHGGVDAGWDVQQSHLCNETPGNSYTEWVEKMGYGKEFAKDWAAEFGKDSPCSSYANEKLPMLTWKPGFQRCRRIWKTVFMVGHPSDIIHYSRDSQY